MKNDPIQKKIKKLKIEQILKQTISIQSPIKFRFLTYFQVQIFVRFVTI